MFKRLKTLLLPVAILAATLGVAPNAAAFLSETRVGGYHFVDAASRQVETTQTPVSQQASAFRNYDTASECSVAAKSEATLYQKVGAQGEHLKFGITKNPATRYTQEELAGGKLRIVAEGSREEMLQLERNIHETLPIGPEEAQKFYIQKQVQKGLKPPPYGGD